MDDEKQCREETAGQFLQRVGMDGKLWAAEMHKRFPQAPEDDLLGWCCNMIMAGYDEAKRQSRPLPVASEDELKAMLLRHGKVRSNSDGSVILCASLEEIMTGLPHLSRTPSQEVGEQKRELSEHEILAKKIADWAKSPEGQKSLADTAHEVREMIEKLDEQRRLDPEELRKPMTI